MAKTPMTVTVSMAAEDFSEFMSYLKDKEMFKRDQLALERDLGMIHDRLKSAISPDPKKPGKYKITDQEYLDDVMIMIGAAAEEV